ncbi:T9SS type A sorting domain-containing protein [Capnocytophaga sp. ARDL2]|uniref:T9SS type A sorting domain-containing protein n=1 Tax=Capnocytophaga sp. ARDL2 TaxID=3238809 RepID=UPI0035579133
MKKFTTFLSLVVCFTIYSQEVLWQKTVGGSHADYLFDMVPTVDYGFLLAGSSVSDKSGLKKEENKGDLDYFLWKMNREGNPEWQLSFGGDGQDVLQSIVQTSDVGYLLGGYSNSGISADKSSENFGKNDLWLVKINAKGQLVWEQSYGGLGNEQLIKIIETQDKGFLILATSNSDKHAFKSQDNFGGLDFWLLKINAFGQLVWEKSFGKNYNDIPQAVVELQDSFVILGNSFTKSINPSGSNDIVILKLDKQGNLLQQKTIGTLENDFSNDLFWDKNTENYTLTGTSLESGIQEIVFWQLDKNFQIIHKTAHSFSGDVQLSSTVKTKDNQYLLAGILQDIRTNKQQYFSLLLDGNGNKIWDKIITTDGDDLLRKAVFTRDQGIVLAGNSTGKNPQYKKQSIGKEDFWILKLKDNGKEFIQQTPLEAIPNPTAEFSQIVIHQSYKQGELSIYDMSGKLYHSEKIKHGIIPVDFSSFPQGVYIVFVKTDSFENSIKVIRE